MKKSLFKKFIINFENNYYTKIVTLFFGTITISLMLLLFVFTLDQAQKSEQGRLEFDKNSFSQFYQILEKKVVSDIYSLMSKGIINILPYNNLTTQSSKNPFIYRNNPFDTTLAYKEQLFNLHQNYPYIKSIDIYNKTFDTYISSIGGVFYNVSKREEDLNKIIPFSIIEKANSSEDSQFWLSPEDNKDFKPYSELTSFVQIHPIFFTKDKYEMIFIINIDSNLIYDDYFKNQTIYDSHFYIIDKNNNLILKTSSDEYLLAVNENKKVAHKLVENKEGTSKFQYKKFKYNLVWKKSVYNDWKYVYISKNPSTFIMFFDTLKFVLFWVLIIISICAIITVFVSRALYKPIGTLLKSTNVNAKTGKINEIKEISEAFSAINKQLFKYETTITKNSSLLLNNIAHNLLDSNVHSLDDLNSWLSILNLYFEKFSFYFFVIKIDSSVFNALTYKEKDFIQLSIREIVENYYVLPSSKKLKIISHFNPNGYITFIINISEDEYKKELHLLPPLLKNLSHEFTEIFNIAVSPVITNLSEFNQEYKKTLTYFKYGFIYGTSNIFDKELIDIYDNNTGLYDTASIKNIKNLLTEGKFEELKQEISIFYSEIKEKNYSYLYTHAISLQIIGMFINEFNQNNLPLPNIEGIDLVSSFSKLTSIEECSNWYASIIDLFSSSLHDRAININNNYMQGIIDYIKENITRVSLNSVSDQFKISTGHLSRMFKKQLGINFSDYISGLKMDYACTLLKETNMKISDIAIELGYFNVNYFNKIFKAKYNITPSQYRKNMNN